MEDHFLYKLRNGQLQNNKVNYRSKKIIEHKKDGNINLDSQKHISKLLEKILDSQKSTLVCLEKITIFQDRQSKAMVRIADSLKELNEFLVRKINYDNKSNENSIYNKNIAEKNFSTKKLKTVKKDVNDKGLRVTEEKELFETVKKMRNNGQTWNAIADYLKKENVSTLTGNGTWSPNLALYFYKKMLSQELSI